MPKSLQKFIELNPVLLRGILVTIAALLAKVVGNTVIDNDTIDLIIDLFVGLSALATALWARSEVIAENKVIAWKLDPSDPASLPVPGPAVVKNDYEMELVYEAAQSSKNQNEVRADLKNAA